MLAQYMAIKQTYPDTLLLYRMGDFYETFFDDAGILAKICNVTLTTRDKKSKHPVPLAGVPYHALNTYLKRLLAAGLTVAICEQVEDPAQAKGLVKREVVEILSPGTVVADELLDEAAGNYCLAWFHDDREASGWAVLEASTGDFICGLEANNLPALCERYAVREVVLPETIDGEKLMAWRKALPGVVVNTVSAAWYHPSFARDTLMDHFKTRDLDPFGLQDESRVNAVSAAGALLRYLTALNKSRPVQVDRLVFAESGQWMQLDEETLRNLEIFQTMRGEKGEGTLFHQLDDTLTPMGQRLLHKRLAEPSLDLDWLSRWHAGVAGVVQDRSWRENVRTQLKRIGDLERMSVRCSTGRIGPAQVRTLGESLLALETVSSLTCDELHLGHPAADLLTDLPDLQPLAQTLTTSLLETAPAKYKTGEVIAAGVDATLDDFQKVASDTRGYLAGLQATERETTGISTLKIGYNKVFGYYLEVTNKHLDKVPEHYQQKQTLVNACRYHTDALKAAEEKILDAQQKIQEIEQHLFQGLLDRVSTEISAIHRWAEAVAFLDLMFCFAETADRRDYACPVCDDSLLLDIEGGRHPVVERLVEAEFIPNDTRLDLDDHQIILLTGPNMGGKSTYLRQVALITLMAQAGSFVPAKRARIGVADRIFTRVGASDNVARGMSTFYAEMSESARILHQMSERSLVILDEVGRGTSTHDGLSLAWAITEYLHRDEGRRPRSIFATHYHELTELEAVLPRLINMRMDVKEWQGKIVFLHTVLPGCSDKSYGIHVARLAGIPESVLKRAETILSELTFDDNRAAEIIRGSHPTFSLTADAPGSSQISLPLFSDDERDALAALRDLDLDHISPMDAFLWLKRIKDQI
jgi:DNA mismatch repair protein MutS